VTERTPRRQRRLALGVLLAAAVLAVAFFPLRATWWGGWILAIAEAGIVGGLADWFAVTAIFRRPLGLPIPHTALIPANWELMAARVGTMVGSRVLSPKAASDVITRLRDLLLDRPLAPVLATAMQMVRRYEWDQRIVTALAGSLGEALDRPAFRATVGELVDDLLARYRERMGAAPRFWIGVASMLGLIDRERVLSALQAGLRQVAQEPDHPVRQRLMEAMSELPGRLRTDGRLAERVEAAKRDLLATPMATRVIEDTAAALHRTLLADLERPRSEVRIWIVERLERARRALIADDELRGQLDRWTKARVLEVVERHHERIAGFIENGVLALGPEGAVRLIEEHAGDDLQYIRVNGTVVGGLAGGLLYAIHLMIRLL